MRELKLGESPRLRVILDQGEFLVRKPKLGEARGLEKALKVPDAETLDVMGDFFAKLGLPKKVFEDLDVDQVEALQGALLPKKKK